MTHSPELTPAPRNEARLRQLDASMQRDELDLLRTSRQEVSDYLRLGRKWGFFALAPKTSERAGREVLANAHMPESNLAALIGDRNPASLAAIEKMADEGLAKDPKFVAGLLISRIKDLYRKESALHGTVALDGGDAAEMLAKEQDPANYLRWVHTPAPVHAVPAWFQVVKKYGMGPEDLNMIYERMNVQSERSHASDVDTLAAAEREALGKLNGSAA